VKRLKQIPPDFPSQADTFFLPEMVLADTVLKMEKSFDSQQVPDLLYPDYRYQRIREIQRYVHAKGVVIPEKIHRVTLFATFRCNLACRYCHTIHHAPKRAQTEYTLARFRSVLEQISLSRIDHIHFTGGEATLVKDLPAMIATANERGILCSLTTNGMAHPEVYRRLVESGLQEVRISCDSHLPEQFDTMVSWQGAYQRVLATIRELVRLRDEEGKPLHLIINMCVGHENQHQLVEFVKRSIALNPDDVKLIPVSWESKHLSQFEERQRTTDELDAFLAEFPVQRFPLLRRKLKTVFDEYTWGLDDPTSKRLMAHCFVPLTERTVDASFYYPCPVYVREGGTPLGSLENDDFQMQQQKTLAFVRGENCPTDPICKQNCINCLKKFNLATNALITNQIRGKNGFREPITNIFEYRELITNTEVWTHLQRVEEERNTFSSDIPYRPFLVIKPKGMTFRKQILSFLSSKQVQIDRIEPIPDWNEVAMRLYSIPLTERRIFFGLLMARVLPQIEGTAQGELLLLNGMYSIDALEQIKCDLRHHLPPSNYVIFYQDEVFCISQGYLHSPGKPHYCIEANVLLREAHCFGYSMGG
jgi:molybdenum cofactor biosynthesis enzyme MoaA